MKQSRWALLFYFLMTLFYCSASVIGQTTSYDTLHFPADREVGSMVISDKNEIFHEGALHEIIEKSARGDIPIPKDCRVKLLIDITQKDLNFLSKCGPTFLIHEIDCDPLKVATDKDLTCLTDDDLARIKKLNHLRRLELGPKLVTDEGLKYFQDLKKLTYLSLTDSPITGGGLSYLKESNLSTLDLSGTQLKDEHLQHLLKIKKLIDLDLSNTPLTDEGADSIAQLTKLQRLNLSGTKLSDHALAQICCKLKGLHTLELNNMPHITSKSVGFITQLPELAHLDLGQTNMDNSVIPFLEAWMRRMQAHSPDGSCFYLKIRDTKISEKEVERMQKIGDQFYISSSFKEEPCMH